MAEINQEGGDKKSEKVRSKKMSTKIDMTPMVDLGFLLITFFMLTTTLQKPKVMELNMPDTDIKIDTSPIKVSESITLTPGEGNRLYWYQGLSDDPNTKVEQTDYSAKGLRQVLLDKKASIKDKFTIVLKPMKKSSHKNMVDILDEFAITSCRRYAIVGIAASDEAIIKKYEADNGIR